jgi:hypothetical protein
MNVYKISEINEGEIQNKLKFGQPCLNINHYFISCENDIFLQLDEVSFKQNFQKVDGKLMVNINITSEFEKQFLIFDNLIINTVNDMFPLWFNKEIDMSDLLEYYVPTVTDCYENNENNEVTSDIFSYTSSEMSENNNEHNDHDENDLIENDLIELSITCDIPYNYEDRDLDIMIFDSDNNMIEELWNNIDVMGKKGICVVKLSGLKIETTKFWSVWELVQLKIC